MIFTGMITSILHVLSGPDHLAAVTPISAENKNKSWQVGVIWGLGHTIGVLSIGLLFLLFREFIPIDLISEYSESVVGFVLLYVGIAAIIKLKKEQKHKHNIHYNKYIGKKIVLSIGVIHGFAGVSHIIGLLPALALPTNFEVFLYIFGFMFGTIATMMLYSQIIGILSSKFALIKKKIVHKMFASVLIVFTLSVGVFWIIKSLY